MDKFFQPNRIYVAVGASSNPNKFGYKVFKWYKDHSIPAVPINPKKETILDTETVPTLQDVPVPKGDDIAISVITPPAVSKALVQSVKDSSAPVHSIWFQPGTHTPEVLDLARQVIPNVITDCILVHGDKYYSMSRL